MLKDLLEDKKVFKLVCGAGNEDTKEIERLVAIYSSAGCNFFDLCAKPQVLNAAKKGLEIAGIKEDRYLCISVGIQGDPHITKALIDQEKCIKCGKCKCVCPHEAIIEFDKYKVKKERCIGCSKCENICPKGAIEMISEVQDYKEILPELISMGIDCIEFHAISINENDILEKWELLNELFDGTLCISLDRSEFGDKKLKSLVQKMIDKRVPYTTIIQADGVAMSGNNDEYGTTLQAIATAQLFQNAKMPAYIMMSGGTNDKSIALAKKCGVEPHALAVGSYARKIVKEYLEMDDLYKNPQKMNEAIKIAKSLVDTVIKREQ